MKRHATVVRLTPPLSIKAPNYAQSSITWFAQEVVSSCVANCVRTVLKALGDGHKEARIRALLSHSRRGVALAAAQAKLAPAEATAEWHTEWNLTSNSQVTPT